jgi:hypothetical protein
MCSGQMKWTESHVQNVLFSFYLFYMYFYNLLVSSKVKPVHTLQLCPHMRHFYKEKDLQTKGPFMYVRVTIAPDGGISRLRLWGYRHNSI